jgi:hypothetical protein
MIGSGIVIVPTKMSGSKSVFISIIFPEILEAC